MKNKKYHQLLDMYLWMYNFFLRFNSEMHLRMCFRICSQMHLRNNFNFNFKDKFRDASPNVFNVYILRARPSPFSEFFLRYYWSSWATYIRYIFQVSSRINATSTSSILNTHSSSTLFWERFSFNLFWVLINALVKIVCYKCIK